MVDTLQFLVMVETPMNRAELVKVLLCSIHGAVQRKANSCELRDNWIEIWKNEAAEPNLVSNTKDGYLHYRWRVESTPMKPTIDELEQVQLAKKIVACFEAKDCRCVICANFEHLL